ncbi:MAG: nickel-dependent hydrogenase large subunit [Rhodobacteraceae bacterium]|nr:nickel-dependent hydrogenase large subunit [Paracoccaceae bacterium]
MNKRLVVDPITRIEGHLRIEAQMQGNQIAEAYSSGTMVRGIEIILKGRDPRDAWAFAQRICGVCTLVHGIASVRAVENALDIKIPQNAQLIRNLMIAAQYVHDHVMHFYHLHALDWVDVVSALDADPKATSDLASSISNYPKSSPGYFSDVKKKLKTFVEQGQLGIFANGYWGHSAYKLPPEANLMAVAHYLDALEWQRDVVQLHTIFGGKNPHPNFLVGGVASPLDPNSDSAINMATLAKISDVISKMEAFVNLAYLPDTLAIAGFYKDWGAIGEGVGNFLTYGDYPTGDTDDVSSFLVPRGVILDRDLSRIHEIDLHAESQIEEYVDHAWYKYQDGPGTGLHPYKGETEFNFTGPNPPYDQLNVDKAYSWLKSPRWKGKPMEVGPLSRMLMLYASGNDHAKELVNMTLTTLDVPVTALFSTLGRTAARTLETKIYLDFMRGWYNDLVANIRAGDLSTHNAEKWDPRSWPKKAQGAGYMEAPRGALGHWIVIEDQKIANYQAVVPTTWNAGPRDHNGLAGPYEAALKGHVLADPEQPLEIIRTIHSFDPCLACAVHMVGEDGNETMQIKIS